MLRIPVLILLALEVKQGSAMLRSRNLDGGSGYGRMCWGGGWRQQFHDELAGQ